MGAKTTRLDDKTNARVQKFPCDGQQRYKVGKARNLTYSQAYDAILKDTGSTSSEAKNVFTETGLQRILLLNKNYCGVARDFIMARREEEKAALAKMLEEVEKQKQLAVANTTEATSTTTGALITA